MSRPETFRHAVFHVVKYAGEAASIAEKFDHPHERDEAVALAKAFLAKRPEHMRVSFDALCDHLRKTVEDRGETRERLQDQLFQAVKEHGVAGPTWRQHDQGKTKGDGEVA